MPFKCCITKKFQGIQNCKSAILQNCNSTIRKYAEWNQFKKVKWVPKSNWWRNAKPFLSIEIAVGVSGVGRFNAWMLSI